MSLAPHLPGTFSRPAQDFLLDIGEVWGPGWMLALGHLFEGGLQGSHVTHLDDEVTFKWVPPSDDPAERYQRFGRRR